MNTNPTGQPWESLAPSESEDDVSTANLALVMLLCLLLLAAAWAATAAPWRSFLP